MKKYSPHSAGLFYIIIGMILLLSPNTYAAKWVEITTPTPLPGNNAQSGALSLADNSVGVYQYRPKTGASSATTTGHVRKWQYYRGIRIFGAEVIQHNQGLTPTTNGTIAQGITLTELTPRLDKQSALQRAFDLYPEADNIVRSSSELVIYLPSGDVQEKLAYYITFFAHTKSGPVRPYVLVDAQDGAILENHDAIDHLKIGTGPGGNIKTGKYNYGSQYPYLDISRRGTNCTLENSNVKTINLNNGTDGNVAYSFKCPQNSYKSINGAYSPLNDAHFFGSLVYQMYQAWLQTPPLTSQLLLKVHYGKKYENAFWDGSGMNFGDGNTTFYPLIAADIVSHEVSHGFTEQHSSLQYWGESGGINEAFSDMAGEAAECYMTSRSDGRCAADFLVGATIFKSNGALRYMADPAMDGISIDNAANYQDGMDVHYTSGIYNKAFYLLASKPGWGIKKAFQVFARANENYWISTTDFNSGACGVQQAASELGYELDDITDSFQQVGVACPTGLHKVVDTYSVTLAQGEWAYYGPFNSTSATLTAELSGSGDADLYLRNGASPTEDGYDCRPFLNHSDERCVVSAGAQTYIGIRGFSSSSTVNLTVTYYRP
jgi:Zinc metalloprotease (elastase)